MRLAGLLVFSAAAALAQQALRNQDSRRRRRCPWPGVGGLPAARLVAELRPQSACAPSHAIGFQVTAGANRLYEIERGTLSLDQQVGVLQDDRGLHY